MLNRNKTTLVVALVASLSHDDHNEKSAVLKYPSMNAYNTPL